MADRDPRSGDEAAGERFVHYIRVRYGDCDMQGVVFNPNYFAYLDDTVDMWFQSALGDSYLQDFEFLFKKATVEWFATATAREVIAAVPEVTRWGRTSFDVSVRMQVDTRLIARGDLVLVSIQPGTHEPVAVPGHVRAALGAQSGTS